eukprot:821943-Alexandrium_andersonii.AAC.1
MAVADRRLRAFGRPLRRRGLLRGARRRAGREGEAAAQGGWRVQPRAGRATAGAPLRQLVQTRVLGPD